MSDQYFQAILISVEEKARSLSKKTVGSSTVKQGVEKRTKLLNILGYGPQQSQKIFAMSSVFVCLFVFLLQQNCFKIKWTCKNCLV